MSAAREHGLPAVAAPRVGVPWTLVALATLLGAVLVGLVVGPVPIGIGEIARSALARVPFLSVATPLDAAQEAIVWELRFPRVVLGALVGGMLALSGASYQGVFRNPLADPYLLGVAAGAGFGATLVIAYGPAGVDGFVLPLASFAGAIAAVVAAYLIGRSVGGGRTTATLILAGVTVAAFLTAAQVFVQQQNSDTLNEVYAWLLGGLTTAGWGDVLTVLPYVALSAAVLLLHRRTLDVLAVGDEEARSLGLDVTRVRLLLVAAATLGTAAAVAVSGLIGFVGIVVPHLVRLVVSSSYRVILPLSVIVGAAFLVLADVRRAHDPRARRAADRRRDRVHRRTLLRARAAHDEELAVSAVAFDSVSVSAGGKTIVDGVSFEVERGEWVSILGPNGAGKTTLLRVLAGTIGFRGEASLDGRRLGGLRRREVARLVALVPQTPVVPAAMTVAEYVLLGRTPHLPPLAQEGAEDRAAAAAALRRLDLDELAGRELGSLSGGELQRAVIGRALAQAAPILLLDEPTTALDIGHQQQVLELVDSLRREEGLTVVAAMHDLTLAAQYGDRVVLVDRGRIVAEGSARDVLTSERVEELYGARVRVVDGVVIPVRQP